MTHTFCYSGTAINYTFFAGQRIAKSYSLTYGFAPDFYFGDHLGSARVITDVSGNLLDDADFYPFGGERVARLPTSGNSYKFTGYERDAESGLDYASARHYNSTLGRFMSPDLLSGSPGYPQSWNRYAYVYDNPLNAIDPSGMCAAPDNDADDPDCDPGNDGFVSAGNGNNGNPNTNWSTYTAVLSYSSAGSNLLDPDLNGQLTVGFFKQLYNYGWDLITFGRTPKTYKVKGSNSIQRFGMKATPYILGAAIPGGPEEELGMVGIEAVEDFEFAEGFDSFAAFKEAYGPAENGYQWHHIVGQTPGNIARFGPEAIHNINNMTQVARDLHIGKGSISAFYSTVQPFSEPLTVRGWLARRSFEEQRNLGLQFLREYGIKIKR